MPTGYSSPILIENFIFLTACENEKLLTFCLDRKTGDIIWKKEAPRPRKEKLDFRNNPASPSPATDGENVYVFFPDFGMLAIRLGGHGDMTEKNMLWAYRRYVPQLPSPLLYEDVLFMINDVGFITSFNPKNGAVINQGRLRGAGSKFFASLVAADKKIFVTSLRGKISLLKSDGSNEILTINDLKEECYATPAIGKGRIYIRTVNTLYCFGMND